MTIPKGFCLAMAIDPRDDEADEAEKDEALETCERCLFEPAVSAASGHDNNTTGEKRLHSAVGWRVKTNEMRSGAERQDFLLPPFCCTSSVLLFSRCLLLRYSDVSEI